MTIFAKDTLFVSSDGEAIRRDGRSRRMTSSSDGNNAKIVKELFYLGKKLIPMTIFTQSRLFSKVLYFFSFLMCLSSGLKAQFCLGVTTEDDIATEDELFVHITAENIKDIASFQFTLHFDPAAYKYLNLASSAIPDYTAENVGVRPEFLAEGNITIAVSYTHLTLPTKA